MKKINSRGFVLAETLVVTVFLMVIFSMIYSYFYPLIGEYEKREVYDDVDGKYAVFWLKKMIEDPSYTISSSDPKKDFFNEYGFIRFRCSDINNLDKANQCADLVKAFQVEGCNEKGNSCNIFITKYKLRAKDTDTAANKLKYKFKNVIEEDSKKAPNASDKLRMYMDNCSTPTNYNSCKTSFNSSPRCCRANSCYIQSNDSMNCSEIGNKEMFRSGFVDYIENLPDFNFESTSTANYRVIASFQHKADNNNYYSYATIEVNR